MSWPDTTSPPHHQAVAPRLGGDHRPALDGLRVLAVYAVVAYHAGLGLTAGGFVGVDLFFVLSGYLVTGSLLRERDRTGSFDLRAFYARRARRLLPAAWVAIAVTALAAPAVLPAPDLGSLVDGARSALLYVANWHFVVEQTDYFAGDGTPSPFLHFWSLAVEEQFYLGLPLLLLLVEPLVRRFGARARIGALAACGAGSLVALALLADEPTRAYFGTDTRMYQLLAGAVLAAVTRRPRVGCPSRAAAVLQPVAVVTFVLLATPLDGLDVPARGVLAAGAAVVLIASLEAHDRAPVARLLSRRRIAHLGRISYGTYLWHWPLIVVLGARTDLPPLGLAVVGGAVGTAIAHVSHRSLEVPVLRASRLDRRPGPVAGAGVAVAALGAALVPIGVEGDWRPESERVATVAVADAPPLAPSSPATSAIAAEQPSSPTTAPAAAEGTEIEIDPAAVRADRAARPDCAGAPASECVVVDGDGPGVHLLGDSHALALLPALAVVAREHGLRLSATVLGGCPWQRGLRYGVTPEHDARCAEHRPDWYERVIPELDPDVVVVAQRGYGDPAAPVPVEPSDGGSTADRPQLLRDRTEATVDELLAEGRRLVAIEPVPVAPGDLDPLACLFVEGDVERCSFEPSAGPTPVEATLRAMAASEPGRVATVDLDPVICPGHSCPPVLGTHVVRRDADHLTATFAETLAPWVVDALASVGLVRP